MGLVELHGDEQKRKEMWGSDRLLVGEPLQVKEDGKAKDLASGVALLLSTRAMQAVVKSVAVSSRVMWTQFG